MYCIFIFYVPAMILLTHIYFRSCGSKLREMENDHAKTSSTNKIISRAARAKNLQRINMPCKGQLISKANYQSENSSENRTNEFVFTTMRRVFFVFWKKLKSPKRHFEIN